MGKRKRFFTILAVIGFFFIIVYFTFRIISFIIPTYEPINLILATLLLIGESYMIIHAFGFLINIIRIRKKRFAYRPKKISESIEPSVAVAITTRNEPIDIIEKTFLTLRNQNYKNYNVYLLDDSDNKEFIRNNEELCKKYGIKFLHRTKPHGAKAGAENDFLSCMTEEYLAVLDADQNPVPDFLNYTVSLAERDKNIGFIQTPQFYSNIKVSPITRAAGMQQSVFYESICEAKGTVNAMFCCGTNVLFRKAALTSIGGFDETSITEDFATSLQLHLAGWKSIYYNHVLVFGMGPESLPAYFKQQYRWAAGTLGVFRKVIFELVKNPFRMSVSQWFEYCLSSTYYLIGWAFLLLMISPITFLLFGIPSYNMSPGIYLGTYVPYFTVMMLLFYGTMKTRHYKMSDVYNGIIMSSLIFPVLMVATFNGIIGKKMSFTVTPKGQSLKASHKALWPWYLAITLNLIAIIFGIIKFQSNPYAISVNIFWACYHLFILFHIFYYNREPEFERATMIGEINEERRANKIFR